MYRQQINNIIGVMYARETDILSCILNEEAKKLLLFLVYPHVRLKDWVTVKKKNLQLSQKNISKKVCSFISTYIYGVACHDTGEAFALILPYANK